MLGAAYQAGALPVSAASIEKAIRLNGVAIEMNLLAFRWGRMAVIDRAQVESAVAQAAARPLEQAPVLSAAAQALVDRSGLLPHQFTLSLTEGDAPMHVLQQAEERGCDLIVIGKHGRQAAEELLLGSVTQHVLTEATCDVLASTAHDHNAIPMPSA